MEDINKMNDLDTFEEESTIILIDEEGQEHEFEVLDILELDGDKYAVLLPLNQDDSEEEEAVLMKFAIDDDGEEVLLDIEDDAEWEKVAAAYERTEID
ncbi:MAG: DUF1292 domain-containing protein [Clostridiales bacterium]|nr:DUF1292 domain-containing protein [Clostridiales bacterium]MDR2712079.1 DUF1292 domain-containing protein [Clostridiales bacterium]